jgi:DNA-binding LacI/PurR family transcriptional regulator
MPFLRNVPQRSSLVAQTARILQEEMLAGRWRHLLPGEHELCGLLHVSRVTLRGALSQLERQGLLRVGQGRRREIILPDKAPPTAAQENRVILLTPAPLQALPGFAVFWIDGLREQLGDVGFHLEIHVNRIAYTTRNPHHLNQLTGSVRPAAWVLYQSTHQMQKHFADQKLPCVITGSRHPGIELPGVDTDYKATCRHAAGLFRAKGHTHMVLLNPETGTGGELESEQGFLEAANGRDIGTQAGTILRHDGTVKGICTRLDSLLRKPNPPTAILVSRPMHALTTLGHLMRKGIKVPGDVALISRDDDFFLDHAIPSVARYSSNPRAFAQKVSKLATDLAREGRLAPTDNRLMPRFVKGDTLG